MAIDRIRACVRKAVAVPLLASGAAAFAQSAPTPSPLDAQAAAALVAPLYKALTASTADAVAPLLEQATSPGWMNCAGNDACQTRAQTLQRWIGRLAVVQRMQWTQKEILVAGSQVVVRGEVSGTPVATFLGQAPQGRSFRVMTIDVSCKRRRYSGWETAHGPWPDSASLPLTRCCA